MRPARPAALHQRFTPAPLALAAAMAIALAASHAPLAHAQSGTAAAATPIAINIPAQPLGQALNELARQANLQMTFPAGLVAGKQAPAVTGNLTARQALDRLLAGSGLVAAAEGSSVVVRLAPPLPTAAEVTLPAVQVTATADAGLGELPKPYAGGQVARGGQLGVFGNLDIMETPVSTTAFTAQAIADTLSSRISDVAKIDPAVRNAWAGGGSDESVVIRGLDAGITLNGLPGLAPPRNSVTEPYERIEVIKGPSGLLTGGAPFINAPGGSINLVTKRAGNEPLTQVTGLFASPSQAGMAVDIGRRLGPDKALGLRVNGVFRDGDVGERDAGHRLGMGSLALDYAAERWRASMDVIHQDRKLTGFTEIFTIAPGIDVPRAPDAGRGVSQPWNSNHLKSTTVMLQTEWDLGKRTSLTLAHARETTDLRENSLFARIVSSDGSADSIFNGTFSIPQRRQSSNATLRHGFDLADTRHSTTLGWSRQTYRSDFGGVFDYPPFTASIYDWPEVPTPPDTPYIVERGAIDVNHGVTLAHQVKAFDERLVALVAVRHQVIKPGVGEDQSGTYPSYGVLYRFTPGFSVYANRLQSLERGPTAPNSGVINPGQRFAPYELTQNEVGAKWDFGGWGSSLAYFDTSIPNTLTVSTATLPRFTLDGEQRFRGIDFTAYGEPVKGVRLIGGLLFLDGKQTRTQDGVNDGRQAAGVARLRSTLNIETDVAALPGLTLTGRVAFEGKQFVDSAASQRLPNFTIFDAGLRYRSSGPSPWTARLIVENLADKNYFTGTRFSGLLGLGAPRTVRASVSYDF